MKKNLVSSHEDTSTAVALFSYYLSLKVEKSLGDLTEGWWGGSLV